jgi:hypothetical protein
MAIRHVRLLAMGCPWIPSPLPAAVLHTSQAKNAKVSRYNNPWRRKAAMWVSAWSWRRCELVTMSVRVKFIKFHKDIAVIFSL